MRRLSVLVHPVIATALVLIAGCSSGGDDATPTTTAPASTTAATTTTSTDDAGDDAGSGDGETCPDADAVEAVLGGPVDVMATSGFSMGGSTDGTALSYQHAGCEFELTDGDQGAVTVTRVTEAEVDGAPFDGSIFATLQDAARVDFDDDGFEPLAELGVEAFRDGSEVVFRSGDAMVFVEVEVDGEASTDAALEMVAALADAAAPIPTDDLDCQVFGALAPESFGAVTDVSVSGGSTMIDDLTIERTGCGADHANGYETSISVADAAQWRPWVAAKEASTFTAHYTELEIGSSDAFDDGEQLVVDDGEQPWIIEASGDDLELDVAEVRRLIAEVVVGG